jgi:hypothetical protein
MEPTMHNLKAAFEEVADWCERHLEGQRGPEIGMTFGAMLRAYGQLATLPTRLKGNVRKAKERELNAKAEKLLLEFATRFLMAHEFTSMMVEATSIHTNMTYDTGPRTQE